MKNRIIPRLGERYGGPVKSNSTGFENAFARKRLLENRQ